MKVLYDDTKFYDDQAARAEKVTVKCEYGNDKLYVNFLPANYKF